MNPKMLTTFALLVGAASMLLIAVSLIQANNAEQMTVVSNKAMQEPINSPETIVDSTLTLQEATAGKKIPEDILNNLRLVNVEYISFDGKLHRGQILVHSSVADEVIMIFAKMREWEFPIEKIVPVVAFNWDDEISMAENNTSAFNYRYIYRTKTLSRHAYGLAIDINPLLNPYIAQDNSVHPQAAVYDPTRPGTLVESGPVVKLFEAHGWEWGGRWTGPKDWQHFEKKR